MRAPLCWWFFFFFFSSLSVPKLALKGPPVLKSGHRLSRADPLFAPLVLCSVQPFPTFGYETQHRSRRAVADGSTTTINHHHEDGMAVAVAAAGEGGDGIASSTAPGGKSDRRYRPTQACTGECCLSGQIPPPDCQSKKGRQDRGGGGSHLHKKGIRSESTKAAVAVGPRPTQRGAFSEVREKGAIAANCFYPSSIGKIALKRDTCWEGVFIENAFRIAGIQRGPWLGNVTGGK